MEKLINRRDLAFQLYEVLQADKLNRFPRYAEHGRDTFEAVLDAAETLALDKFVPHAAKADEQEPTFDGETVTLIPEIKDALQAYVNSGFLVAGRDEDEGGMALPVTIAQACAALFTAANASTTAYPFLTIAASNLLDAYGSPAQKERYLKPMLEGRFFGTMCLSEPQAGSSLADIRTRAEPQADGSYRLKGSKMWISAGEHDLSDTIIHLVLAKIPGGPAGTKGISLFIVPKHHVDADGTVSTRNDVVLAGLNHKMGYRGTTNCLLNFGEKDGAVGYLVGEPHKGLHYMFHMMNEARIGVGLGATMMGYAGYLYALDYARGRPQGRLPGNKDPESPPVPIIEHADVRRMLLTQKTYVEGALLLNLYCAMLVDEQKHSEDKDLRDENGLLLEILTPIAKAWPSDYCLEANKLAMQCLGGYGYTRDYPLERLYRDNRLNPIHEGTNGIQGLDLLGRKAMMADGAALKALANRMMATVAEAQELSGIQAYGASLAQSVQMVAEVTAKLAGVAARGDVETFLANSNAYLELVGHTVVAWMWLKQAVVAIRAHPSSEADLAFYKGKLSACHFFFLHELPKTHLNAAILNSLDRTALDIVDAGF